MAVWPRLLPALVLAIPVAVIGQAPSSSTKPAASSPAQAGGQAQPAPGAAGSKAGQTKTPAAPAGTETRDAAPHFTAVGDVEFAVVRGDLEAAQAAARTVATGSDQYPAQARTALDRLKSAAEKAASASDLKTAGAAAGEMSASCGQCHNALGKTIQFKAIPKPEPGTGTASHMQAHQWSIQTMARGLQGPSDPLWEQGARELRGAALLGTQLPEDPAHTKEMREAEQNVHVLAAKAAQTTGAEQKSALYGELLATCGGCHGLHGRVWGPGVPKP